MNSSTGSGGVVQHPVLRWMDNIFIRTDSAGNIKADKEKSTEKLDGAIAVIMELDRAIRCGNESSESVYDTRGPLVLLGDKAPGPRSPTVLRQKLARGRSPEYYMQIRG